MGKKRQRDEGQAGGGGRGGGGGGGKGGRGLSGEKAAGWQVPRIPLSDMSSARFVEEFMIPNLPVIITGLVEPWPVSDLDILSSLQRFYTSVHTCLPVSTHLDRGCKAGDVAGLALSGCR